MGGVNIGRRVRRVVRERVLTRKQTNSKARYVTQNENHLFFVLAVGGKSEPATSLRHGGSMFNVEP